MEDLVVGFEGGENLYYGAGCFTAHARAGMSASPTPDQEGKNVAMALVLGHRWASQR